VASAGEPQAEPAAQVVDDKSKPDTFQKLLNGLFGGT
jgi:hypothetical protein